MDYNRNEHEREIRAFIKYKNLDKYLSNCNLDKCIESQLDLWEYEVFYHPKEAPKGAIWFTDKYLDILKEAYDSVNDATVKEVIEISLLKYLGKLTTIKRNLYVYLIISLMELDKLDEWIDNKKYKRIDKNE